MTDVHPSKLDLLLNAFQTHPNIPKEIKQQMEVVKNDG